jgi:cyanophycin synthetase
LELLQSHASGTDFAIEDHFRALFDFADDVRLGPSSRAILDAAVQRGISYFRLNRGSLVQLGEGRFQRRIWTAETDATSAIAESIASDKDLTKRLLRNAGIPVPLGRLVTDPEDAWVAALEVGLPVVVKPRDANHQRGISIELSDRLEILKAYQYAIEDGQTQDVMVEQFARGQHHRLLVVGNKMVAASRGHSETVTGDGKRTISQLVAEVNSDPRRGEAYTHPLSVVVLDAGAHIELAKQGLTVDSIPEPGRVVIVCRNGDLTTDCTEVVHPETARQAALAARVVGLDVAGLDVLATDISHPLAEQQGAVVEINAGPSLSSHVTPLFGRPQPVGEAIVDMLFPEGRTSRIAILGCLVGGSTEAQQEFQQWILACHKQFACVGQVDEGGITVGQQRIPLSHTSVAQRAQAILQHPDVDAMILPIDMRELARSASPVPRMDRLVVCLAAGDSLDFESSDDAWSTLRHTRHPETCIDWCMASDAQRAFIATRLAVS